VFFEKKIHVEGKNLESKEGSLHCEKRVSFLPSRPSQRLPLYSWCLIQRLNCILSTNFYPGFSICQAHLAFLIPESLLSVTAKVTSYPSPRQNFIQSKDQSLCQNMTSLSAQTWFPLTSSLPSSVPATLPHYFFFFFF
jgi:hypothetical protein